MSELIQERGTGLIAWIETNDTTDVRFTSDTVRVMDMAVIDNATIAMMLRE